MVAKLPDLHSEVLLFDGAMGTMIQQKGALVPGEAPELLNLTKPEIIAAIHRAYFEAGSRCVESNTFGANKIKLASFGLADKVREINTAGIKIAKQAAPGNFLVAASLGPTGKMLEPLGELAFEVAFRIFLEQCRSFAEAEADLVIIETMSDIREVKAAILAVLEVNLPVIASVSFMENERLLTGFTPEMVAASLSGFPLVALGTNCGLSAASLKPIVKKLIAYSKLPVIVQPNAGKPSLVGSKTVYQESADEFASASLELVSEGARIIGGCCGTTPHHIQTLRQRIHHSRNLYHPEITEDYLVGKKTLFPVTIPFARSEVWRLKLENGTPLWDKFLAGDEDNLVDTLFDIDDSRYKMIEIDGSTLTAADSQPFKKLIQLLVTYWPNPITAQLNHPGLIAVFLQNNPGRSLVKINSNSAELMPTILRNGGIIKKSPKIFL
jgi:5-methyltetrahydrofolate--homocysteine methyltransferase